MSRSEKLEIAILATQIELQAQTCRNLPEVEIETDQCTCKERTHNAETHCNISKSRTFFFHI